MEILEAKKKLIDKITGNRANLDKLMEIIEINLTESTHEFVSENTENFNMFLDKLGMDLPNAITRGSSLNVMTGEKLEDFLSTIGVDIWGKLYAKMEENPGTLEFRKKIYSLTGITDPHIQTQFRRALQENHRGEP